MGLPEWKQIETKYLKSGQQTHAVAPSVEEQQSAKGERVY